MDYGRSIAGDAEVRAAFDLTYRLLHELRDPAEEPWLDDLGKQVWREAGLVSFRFFVEYILGYHPSVDSTKVPLRDFHFQMRDFAHAHRRALVLAPRDHGKSEILTVADTLHEIVTNPNVRICIVTKVGDQAKMLMSLISRHLLENRRLRELYGRMDERADEWTRHAITVNRTRYLKEPTVMCMSTGGTVLSFHYDVIKADDVADARNCATEHQQKELWNWFMGPLMPTLDPRGRISVTGTRWAVGDLYGRLIELADRQARGEVFCRPEERWHYLVLKAIQDDGTALWPERHPIEELRSIQAANSVLFDMMYQNIARLGVEGALVQEKWLQYYDVVPRCSEYYAYVDLTVTEKETSDYFSYCVVGVTERYEFYVVDWVLQHLTPNQQIQTIKHCCEVWRPVECGVESVAFSGMIPRELQMSTSYPITAVKPVGDKVTRLLRVLPYVESGRVKFSRKHRECLEQLLQFPLGRHDDAVDSLAGALDLAARYAGTGERVRRLGMVRR